MGRLNVIDKNASFVVCYGREELLRNYVAVQNAYVCLACVCMFLFLSTAYSAHTPVANDSQINAINIRQHVKPLTTTLRCRFAINDTFCASIT